MGNTRGAAGYLEPSRSLELILEAEGRGGLGELEFTPFDLSMWAYVRWLIALQLGDAIFGRQLVVGLPTAPRTLRGRAEYFVQAVAGHPRLHARRQFPIAICCSGVGNYLRDGSYFNRLADHFADSERDRTFVIEDSDVGVFRKPRQFPHVAYHDWVTVRAAMEAKLRPLSAADRAKIDDFVARVRELLGDHLGDQQLSVVRAQLAKYSRWCHAWRSEYLWLFDRLAPRLLLLEDACYGMRSHIIRWARERGIATAEYQHGYVGVNHEAYNYHPELVAGRYRDNFPDYFLTYGRYWGEQTRMPSEQVVIGNPHLSEAARSLGRATGRSPTVLFVSGDISTAYYREVLPAIASALPADHRLLFRPHPSERPLVEQRYRDIFDRYRIGVDNELLALQSVVDADLIVGDVSTLLFEADALGKPVVVLEYEVTARAVPAGLFPLVREPARVVEFLGDTGAADRQTPRSELWASDWQRNYRQFVHRVLG